MNTPTKNHDPNLLVDIGAGVLLEYPPNPIVTRRYVESHPFIELVENVGKQAFVIAGPDAAKVAKGSGGVDYVQYVVEKEVGGSLHLRREV